MVSPWLLTYEAAMTLGVIICLAVNVRTLNRSHRKYRIFVTGTGANGAKRIFLAMQARTDLLLTLAQLCGLSIALWRLVQMAEGSLLLINTASCIIGTIRFGMSVAIAGAVHLNNRDARRIATQYKI